MLSLLAALEASDPITAIRSTPALYALVNGTHILGLAVMLGAILTVDLRVIGIWRAEGWREGLRVASPIAALGLMLSLVTGFFLFAVRPGHYLGNGPFLFKLALVACGVVNAVLFHTLLLRSTGTLRPLILRLLAAASVLVWCGALFAGRFIAFVY
ncbi:DUF6644 family protein [Brucellaceae bacterium D45D]